MHQVQDPIPIAPLPRGCRSPGEAAGEELARPKSADWRPGGGSASAAADLRPKGSIELDAACCVRGGGLSRPCAPRPRTPRPAPRAPRPAPWGSGSASSAPHSSSSSISITAPSSVEVMVMCGSDSRRLGNRKCGALTAPGWLDGRIGAPRRSHLREGRGVSD